MYLQHVKINDIVSGEKMSMLKVMNKLIYKPGLESESTSFTLQRLSCWLKFFYEYNAQYYSALVKVIPLKNLHSITVIKLLEWIVHSRVRSILLECAVKEYTNKVLQRRPLNMCLKCMTDK